MSDPQTVKAVLEVTTVDGQTFSHDYQLPISENGSVSETLQDYNKRIKKEIEENNWLHRFEPAIQTRNIISYKLTRKKTNLPDKTLKDDTGDNE